MFHQENSFKDYFAILEVSPFASSEVIQASYRALAKIYHPDLGFNSSLQTKSITDINEAYEVLSDPSQKEIYWENFLEEMLKKERFQEKQNLYFYKNWGEMLQKQEKQIKETSKTKEPFSKEGLNEYIKKFLSSSGKNLQVQLQEILKAPKDVKDLFLQEVIKTSSLTLEMEENLLKFILKEKQKVPLNFIAKGFKYKNLYVDLLDYIKEYQITSYGDKIYLIVKNSSLNLEANVDWIIKIFDIPLPENDYKNLQELVKEKCRSISFWEKRKYTPTHKEKYKVLKKMLYL